MPKISNKPKRNNEQTFKPIIQDETKHQPVAITLTKSSRKVSFEDPKDSMSSTKDVTSSFLNSEFALRTNEKSKSLVNTKPLHSGLKPKSLSRLSRSGCLKSMAQDQLQSPAVGLPTVSDENLSSSSDNDEENTTLCLNNPLSGNNDSVSSMWGQFVDVIPIDLIETSLSKKRRLKVSRRKSLGNINHFAPYTLKNSRSRTKRLAKNKSCYFSNECYQSASLTDQISDALCQLQM
jgi:hypothetical protein